MRIIADSSMPSSCAHIVRTLLLFMFMTALCSYQSTAQSLMRRDRIATATTDAANQETSHQHIINGSSRCCVLLASAGFNPQGTGYMQREGGGLPLVLIDTEGVTIPDLVRVPASLCTCGSPNGIDYDGEVMIEIRGSSSARDATKKSYSFNKLHKVNTSVDESSMFAKGYLDPPSILSDSEASTAVEASSKKQEKSRTFMGFPPGDTFDLYGPENDRTMGMRNLMAMWVGRSMGHYASRTQYCEMFLVQDGLPLSAEKHYWGVYLAMEKIERSKSRVDITALNPWSEEGDQAQGIADKGELVTMQDGLLMTAHDDGVSKVASSSITPKKRALAAALMQRQKSLANPQSLIHTDHRDTQAEDEITGGYLIRYEHGKVKNHSVTFTALNSRPGTGNTSDILKAVNLCLHGGHRYGELKDTASLPGFLPVRPLPYILAYPDLNSVKWHIDSSFNLTHRQSSDMMNGSSLMLDADGSSDVTEGQIISQISDVVQRERQQVLQYISRYMTDVEVAFQLTSYCSNITGSSAISQSSTSWRDLVDESAFIDYMLATELTKNPDGYRGSVYMSKDRGEKLMMGPMWDYNEAFGLCCGFPIQGWDHQGVSNGSSGGSAISVQGWRFNICEEPLRCLADPIDGVSLWYQLAWKDMSFRESVAQRWQQLRASPGGALSDSAILSLFSNATVDIEPAAMRNYRRWADVLSSPYFESDKEQFHWSVAQLVNWTVGHVQWMDQELMKVVSNPRNRP
ncbi:hypothetical protein CEUSTIGMA_g939.t1 [Chlamydomonas eustigma]|uniref:Secreted protein n=1 Tax=Chlamydomonas eustigma TaxID=1157962 RepID=A0A250WRL1_9CHLO|nr:hypothetical protein CEUSTIGMA_g939.t1 [Chlamydomonas eustigma]|eukprot:GAX73487.1 hypothetical protein CEUSTIGMA_g939.t1 [Chlamydomonas eustigma]